MSMQIIPQYALKYDCPKCGAKKGQPCGYRCCVPRLHKATADPEVIAMTVAAMCCGCEAVRNWAGD